MPPTAAVTTPIASSYIPPTLPTPAATGPLTATPVATFPGTASGVVAAEAPDGTVFAVPEPQSGQGTVAYVVDGTAAPQIAEHLDAPVVAVAADSGSFYAATTRDVTEFDRTTGDRIRSWPVVLSGDQGQSDVAFAGGRLWLYTAAGTLVEIDPASPTPKVVSQPGVGLQGIAADATGAYVVEAGGQTLLHVAIDGSTRTAPTRLAVGPAQAGGASVTAVAVVDSTLVVAQQAGETLDASLVTYDTATLRRLTIAATTVPGTSVVPTLAGPLVVGAGAGFCSGHQVVFCVARTTLAAASTTPAYQLGSSGLVVSELIGPYPAVITNTGSSVDPGTLQLLRLQ